MPTLDTMQVSLCMCALISNYLSIWQWKCLRFSERGARTNACLKRPDFSFYHLLRWIDPWLPSPKIRLYNGLWYTDEPLSMILGILASMAFGRNRQNLKPYKFCINQHHVLTFIDMVQSVDITSTKICRKMSLWTQP